MGSGFLVDAKGYVVTNHHVVGNASEITVTLHDGSSLPATLVGSDPKTDLAVVKVETETDRELPYARFGDSETIRAGDWVLAIGNPFGLGSSATAGIVSARGRDLQSGPFDDFIQIDAPINQGNSGGPLFDRTGRVVGVNTAIYSPNGGNVGIGFAIPASLAGPIIEELKTKGHVERGWLGVEIQAIDDDLADALGLEKAEGALVANVVHESPADDAGLVAGDVIVGVNGESTPRLKDVTRAIAEVEPNDAARIDLVRDGKKISVDVEIGRSPDSPEAVRARADANGKVDDDSGPRLGLALADLTADIKRQLGIDGEVEGAVVARVERDSPAARQGLRRGDVIIAVGRNGVTDAESAIRAIDELEKEGRPSVLLRVQRGSTASFVAVPFA
jgi:serine protease Do